MSHLDDGTLQAFLDGELDPTVRAEVAEHMLACDRCRTTHGELTRANALFAEAVSALDTESPSGRAPSALGRQARRGAGSFVKAAGLILALAAAASAAVPGSPVHELIVNTMRGEPEVAEVTPPPPEPEAEPVVEPAPPAPAGVSIVPVSGPAVVSLEGLTDVTIRLERADATAASVAVVSAVSDPVFRTGLNRVEVVDGAGGEILVRLPVGAAGSRLIVDGRVYAEVTGGAIEARVPAETVDGALVWR
jgi:anti-sigma factor RsiW